MKNIVYLIAFNLLTCYVVAANPYQSAPQNLFIGEKGLPEIDIPVTGAQPRRPVFVQVPIKGHVLCAETREPAEGYEIVAVCKFGFERNKIGVTDSNGNFSGNRSAEPLFLIARKPGSNLAGIVEICDSEQEANLELHPTATISGRLVEAASDKPLVDRDVRYGFFHPNGTNTIFVHYEGNCKTDENG
ncbi:MAG: hypothetical protein ACRC2T_12095, partial [Thermoguttaceae bacterium]